MGRHLVPRMFLAMVQLTVWFFGGSDPIDTLLLGLDRALFSAGGLGAHWHILPPHAQKKHVCGSGPQPTLRHSVAESFWRLHHRGLVGGPASEVVRLPFREPAAVVLAEIPLPH